MNQRNRSPQRPELGFLGLLLTLAVLGAVAAFFRDTAGLRFGNLGALIWMTIAVIAFALGILYFAQYVLPRRGNEGWGEGLQLLVRFYFAAGQNYLERQMGGGGGARRSGPRRRSDVKTERPEKRRDLDLPTSFKLARAGIVPSHQALVINQGNTFARVAGPGFVMLFRRERVAQVVDLRPHKRSQPVQATTRDGIPVGTSVSVTFQVRQRVENDPFDPMLYPYDPDAVFQVSTFNSIDESGETRAWYAQLAPQAAALLASELSAYTLDDLQQRDARGERVQREVKQRVQRQLERSAAAHGLTLTGFGIGAFSFPDKIMEQRIKAWQAAWQRRIEEKHAAGDAEAARRLKQARARAQIEIIEKITESIESLRQQGETNLTEVITLRMIEALEEATGSDSVQALIPQQVMANLVMDASNQMQRWLGRPQEPDV